MDKKIDRVIQKFEMKLTRIPINPLDYILVLPKKVYMILIERTREKMLFSKQEILMEMLQSEKDQHKKFKGLEMDDLDIA